MKIQYRFYKKLNELKQIGFDIPSDSVAFVISDDDKKFEEVKNWLGENWLENVINIDTDFTEKERSESLFLSIETSKMLGYPQPEEWDEDEGEAEPPYPFNIYPYFQNVFEVANTSPDYGMLRGKQIGSFSFLGEPKWGKSSIGSIFWCGDAYFTTLDIYKQIFEPLGIKSKAVLGYGNQELLKTVLQLLPQGISESKLIIKEDQILEMSDIPEWNLKKYVFNGKGFFPSFENDPGNYDFFVSQEYFGSGGVNEKTVFISQKLYLLLKKHNIKGLKYYPQFSNNLHKNENKYSFNTNRRKETSHTWTILD